VSNGQIRVAVVGVGNCASSLVQTVAAAQAGTLGDTGVAHPAVGGYHVDALSFVAAFDVDKRKIGYDLSAAILAAPNCTTAYVTLSPSDVMVSPGPLADGVPDHLADIVDVSDEVTEVGVDDVAEVLRHSGAEVVVNYLPTGSRTDTSAYAAAALAAGAAFVNCNPERIGTDRQWQERFAAAGVPLLGDDIRSQLGATRVHRALLELCQNVGAATDRTYQLNFGGNTDFLNMFEPSRAVSKRRSKERAIASLVPAGAQYGAGPAGYVQYLADEKVAYIRIEGRLLLGMPFTIETRLSVEDSPNSAGVVIDAIRAAKTAADRGQSGVIAEPSSYLFKSPPELCNDGLALARFEEYAA
jgi:myo-inositol-1-phosphate synthase